MALVTDGRMSGASGKVPAAIHVTPEAADGGPLAYIRDGDLIRLDALRDPGDQGRPRDLMARAPASAPAGRRPAMAASCSARCAAPPAPPTPAPAPCSSRLDESLPGMKPQYSGLVGDVGGTNARFALIDGEGRVRNLHIYPAADYARSATSSPTTWTRTWAASRPPRAVIAVAGPVVDGEIEFTNLDWRFSEGELLAQFEFEAVRLINDFAAQALACPMLGADALQPLGPQAARRRRLRPWWCWAPAPASASPAWRAASAATWRSPPRAATRPSPPPTTSRWRSGASLRARHGRVSIERILSGPRPVRALRRPGRHAQAEPALADEKAV